MYGYQVEKGKFRSQTVTFDYAAKLSASWPVGSFKVVMVQLTELEHRSVVYDILGWKYGRSAEEAQDAYNKMIENYRNATP